MLVQHLKFAVRHLVGSLLYSAINILGLSIGLACCLLILLYVRFESSYDTGWANGEQLYRVSREYHPFEGARARVPAQANAPVAPALKEDFPEQVEAVARIFGGSLFLETDERGFEEPSVRFADPELFNLFDFEWLAGDPNTALAAPASIVLTESLARKYFGTTDAVGRTLRLSRQTDVQVTGVIADLPANTHLDLSGVIALSTLVVGFGPNFLQNWSSGTDFHSYLLLRSPDDAAFLQQQLPAFLERHIGAAAAQNSELRLMPIRDIHLYSMRDEEWKPLGDARTLRNLVLIAFSILVIACINFMAIATARATRRSKEVGMRKAIGATPAQLLAQFLLEAGMTVSVALLGAIALMELSLPSFSTFTGIPPTPPTGVRLLDAEFLLVLALLLTTLSVMAGLWSSLFLGTDKPAKVLRGALDHSGQRMRNALVVSQFAIAITLVVATLVMQAQRSFIANFDLGFDKDEIVILRSPEFRGFGQQWPALKAELLNHPAIEGATASHYLPFGFNDNQMPLKVRGSSLEMRVQFMLVDFDFFETYGIEFVQGRGFSPELDGRAFDSSDSLVFVLNSSAASALGLAPETAVDTTLDFVGTGFSGTVLGVTSALHFETLRLGERPLIFVLSPPQVPQETQAIRDAAIRIDLARVDEALAHIDATWRAFNPDQPVNRHFLREDHAALYLADTRQGQLLSIFSTIAIAVGCFGLFGLASYNAERRTKEIGVRKVMGSSVWSIVLLLTNDFSRLVLLANLIAWPIAYFAMQRWLENFVYRIDLTPLIFIGSGAIALCIAWVTVAGTAAKAASAKPVLALRYE